MKFVPERLVAPLAHPITLEEAKLHLRVDGDDEDTEIAQQIEAAVAELDGWTGDLCRCIMAQTWSIRLYAGPSLLPFPDVSEARVGADQLEVLNTTSGPLVILEEDGVVEFDCGLKSDDLERVKMALKLLLKSWYDGIDTPEAYYSICNKLRYRNV